jgi:hypothetical protein
LLACSPTATRQPRRFEKTVLKECAFIGNKASISIPAQHGGALVQAAIAEKHSKRRFDDFISIILVL